MVWIIASVLLYGLMQYLSGLDAVPFKLLTLGLAFATNIVGALMAFVVLQKAADKLNWSTPIFGFLSKRSMIIYLFHQQIIYFVIYSLNGLLNPYLHAVVNFVVALIASALIATLMMKFQATRFLIGEK